MARNYKRDTRGRFARIAGQKARGSSSARGQGGSGVRKLSSTGIRAAPIQKPAKGRVLVGVDSKGRTTKVTAAQVRRIQSNNRRIAAGAIAGAVAGGYLGAHAGVLGVGPGAYVGSHVGASIANRANQRRR